METKVDPKKVIKEVRKIAKKHPEATYKSYDDKCLYLAGQAEGVEGSGCLIGRALMKLYPETRATLFNVDADNELDPSIKNVLTSLFNIEYNDEVDWLDTVQNLQDNGHEWAKCIVQADELNNI